MILNISIVLDLQIWWSNDATGTSWLELILLLLLHLPLCDALTIVKIFLPFLFIMQSRITKTRLFWITLEFIFRDILLWLIVFRFESRSFINSRLIRRIICQKINGGRLFCVYYLLYNLVNLKIFEIFKVINTRNEFDYCNAINLASFLFVCEYIWSILFEVDVQVFSDMSSDLDNIKLIVNLPTF